MEEFMDTLYTYYKYYNILLYLRFTYFGEW